MAPHVFMAIEQAALRAVKEGIYQHHPGAPDDAAARLGEVISALRAAKAADLQVAAYAAQDAKRFS